MSGVSPILLELTVTDVKRSLQPFLLAAVANVLSSVGTRSYLNDCRTAPNDRLSVCDLATGASYVT
jgi:hypothetical protein